jgi:hypothetical protein
MKTVKVYIPESLVSGSVIKKKGIYVAVPDRNYKGCIIKVLFNGKEKIIKNWLKADAYRRFPDQWGRGIYTLGYFKWE